MQRVAQNCVAELSFVSTKPYTNPPNEVELDLVVVDPEGRESRVPAYWAGGEMWGARYASSVVGLHRYRTICSDPDNNGLHGQTGMLEVVLYEGSNPLLRHGPLRVAADRRHLEHQDGTPFFWLGDTWWMGLCRRLSWPDDFRELTADRVAKGFTVIQIVAGLYPDMEPFDARGANEAGFPWEPGFTRLNPVYFDMADLRIAHLVRSGLVPCIVGSWGYYMEFAGETVLRQHWRNLVARYSAYPVIWCVAGEALMPYYLRRERVDLDMLRRRWSELARYIRRLDPRHNPITIHPTRYGHDQVDDVSVLDVDMLQTGHAGYPTLADTLNFLSESLALHPEMPVLVGEVNYEGIMESSREEIQRFLFWSCMLSGAAGHTYGANGIWQVNRRDEPYGLSPHGSSWGDMPWDEVYRLPGSRQLGLGKALLERYPWWRFVSRPEWVRPHQSQENRLLPYVAGIPGQVRVIFIPAMASWIAWRGDMVVGELEADVTYRAFWFDPKTGSEHDLEPVASPEGGEWVVPKPPVFQDWVLVLEAMGE